MMDSQGSCLASALTVDSKHVYRAVYQDQKSFGDEPLFYSLLYEGETKTADVIKNNKAAGHVLGDSDDNHDDDDDGSDDNAEQFLMQVIQHKPTSFGTGFSRPISRASAFGTQTVAASGTEKQFAVVTGMDQEVKSGVQYDVRVRFQCITAKMDEYKDRSLEELRVEDYQLGRKEGFATAKNASFTSGGYPAVAPAVSQLKGTSLTQPGHYKRAIRRNRISKGTTCTSSPTFQFGTPVTFSSGFETINSSPGNLIASTNTTTSPGELFGIRITSSVTSASSSPFQYSSAPKTSAYWSTGVSSLTTVSTTGAPASSASTVTSSETNASSVKTSASLEDTTTYSESNASSVETVFLEDTAIYSEPNASSVERPASLEDTTTSSETNASSVETPPSLEDTITSLGSNPSSVGSPVESLDVNVPSVTSKSSIGTQFSFWETIRSSEIPFSSTDTIISSVARAVIDIKATEEIRSKFIKIMENDGIACSYLRDPFSDRHKCASILDIVDLEIALCSKQQRLLPHGKGVLRNKREEVIYDGEWQDGKRSGNGSALIKIENCSTSIDSNGFYEGEWTANMRHGRGHMIFLSGADYKGEWLYDKMHGVGTMKYLDGTMYQGVWRDDTPHGYGIFTCPDGKREYREYNCGKMVQSGLPCSNKEEDRLSGHGEVERLLLESKLRYLTRQLKEAERETQLKIEKFQKEKAKEIKSLNEQHEVDKNILQAEFSDEIGEMMKMASNHEKEIESVKKSKAELRKQLDEEKEARLCQICFVKPQNCIIMPCLHLVYCDECVNKHRDQNQSRAKCPACNTFITGQLNCKLLGS